MTGNTTLLKVTPLKLRPTLVSSLIGSAKLFLGADNSHSLLKL